MTSTLWQALCIPSANTKNPQPRLRRSGERQMGHYPQVITVTSGKGGVGKTNIAVNLACQLGEKARVILLDADLGLANVDVLLGVTPPHELSQLFSDGIGLGDILFPTPFGFSILPTASGLENIVELSTGQKLELLNAMDSIADSTDYLIVDTGAGINTNVLYFCMAASSCGYPRADLPYGRVRPHQGSAHQARHRYLPGLHQHGSGCENGKTDFWPSL